jgi:hypothetical protein
VTAIPGWDAGALRLPVVGSPRGGEVEELREDPVRGPASDRRARRPRTRPSLLRATRMGRRPRGARGRGSRRPARSARSRAPRVVVHVDGPRRGNGRDRRAALPGMVRSGRADARCPLGVLDRLSLPRSRRGRARERVDVARPATDRPRGLGLRRQRLLAHSAHPPPPHCGGPRSRLRHRLVRGRDGRALRRGGSPLVRAADAGTDHAPARTHRGGARPSRRGDAHGDGRGALARHDGARLLRRYRRVSARLRARSRP